MSENYFSLITAALMLGIYIGGARLALYKWRWDIKVSKAENLQSGSEKEGAGEERREKYTSKLNDQINKLDSMLFWSMVATIIAIVRGGLLVIGVSEPSALLAIIVLLTRKMVSPTGKPS